MSPSFLKDLDQIGRTLVRWKASLYAVFGVAAVLGVVWLLAMVDIVFRHERVGRMFSWGIFVLAALALLALVIRTLRHRYTTQGVAATVERAFPELDNHLINYIQFSEAVAENNPFKQAYLKHAPPVWEQVEPKRMKNVDAHKKGWIALLVALVFLVLPGFFLGAAWPRAVQRMLNPFADLPPVSLTHILSVEPGDTEVVQGNALVLSCRVQGMKGHEVSIQMEPDDGARTRTSLGQISSIGEESFSRRIPKVTTGLRYRFKAGDATPSDWYRVDTRPPAAFTDLQLTISPPAYMGLPPQTVDARAAGLHVTQGSSVTLTANANATLRNVTLAQDGGSPVSLQAGTNGSKWSGEMTVSGGAGLLLRGEDELGTSVEERLPYVLSVDAPPRISISEPSGRMVLPPGAQPKIMFAVEDDFGVAGVDLERQRIAGDGTKSWEVVERWPVENRKTHRQSWLGSVDARKGGALTYRLVARDGCQPEANVAASVPVVFDVQTRAEAAKERKKLEDKASEGLEQVISLQKENLKATQLAAKVADKVTPAQWATLLERQTKVRTLTRELLENPLKPLGGLTDTARKVYLNEMSEVLSVIAGIPETSPDQRANAAMGAEQIELRILRQLTAANFAMEKAKVDRRLSGIAAMLAKMISDQKDVIKKATLAQQNNSEVSVALVDQQDYLASDLQEFATLCSQEAAEVRANDATFAEVLTTLSQRCESDKLREDMLLAADQLDQNQPAEAIPHASAALNKLIALQTLLDGVKLQQEAEEREEMAEGLGNAKEKIARVKDLHKRMVEFMDQIKEMEDVSDEQMEMMEDAYEAMLKNTKEALLEVPTDLHIFMDLNVANELVEDVFTTYQEIEQAEGSETTDPENITDLAYNKEEQMLAMMEEAEERIDDVERWLTENPETTKVTTEAFDKEEMADEMALGALPTELQDLITDLKEQDEETAEEADDGATNHGVPDIETGGPAMEGDLTTFAAKGVSGGDRPDHKEQDGRSNVGRQGMSNGETAAGSGTVNEGDNNMDARRTTDPTQGGQVDLDGDVDIVATGGGKLATGKADEAGMGGGVRRMDSTEEGSWDGMAALLAKRADSIYAKASMKNIRVESLQTAAHHIRQSRDAVAKGDIEQVRELRRLAVSALVEAQTDLQGGATPAYEAEGSASVLGGMVESSTDTAPPQYRDQVAEYYKVLNDVL